MAAIARCDYLVVGGGAAGCIIARRLAQDPGKHVILLEAGKTDEGDPVATDLSRLEEQDDSYDWGYHAWPHAGAQHPMQYNRAKMLGGCANHNDCAFLAPPASDLERWAALGAEGWDPVGAAAALQRIEAQLHIEPSPPGTALSRAFIDACIELGLPELNFRERIDAGGGWFPLNAKDALRQSSSIAYLHPLRDLPPNLEVRSETLATRILVEQGRARGVETDRGRIDANAEVIVCAGSINTPQLMLLSGIGPGEDLQALGIPLTLDLPGVGRNLMDHPAANLVCALRRPVPQWRLTPCEATALIRIDADAPAPDVLFHFVLMLRDKYSDVEHYAGIEHGIKLSPNVARPKSRGRLRLERPDIHAAPRIELNYFSDADGYDRRILLAGLREARELCASDALADWIDGEVLPGAEVVSDDDLFAYVLETCETVYHPCGTCRIGARDDAQAVVTPDLRVRGIDRLRVADASVFPSMVTVNICNSVMMVAERAAELISG